MKHKLISAALAVSCLFTELQAGPLDNWLNYLWKKEQTLSQPIKILIVHDQPGAILEVKGKYQLFDPNTDTYLSTRFIGKRKFVQATRESLKWGEEFPGIHQIKIVPEENRATTFIDGVEYNGDVYIYDIGGTVSIVNEIDVEEYLKSTLIPQFDNSLPQEELAAIAIAARTNAYYLAKHPKNTYWAVDASKVGYEGFGPIQRDSAIKKAINDTRHMVMVKDGNLFPAEWGSTTGGKTQRDKAIFSRVSLFDAEEMAKKGEHAAQILSKAFPGSSIKLMTQP